MEFISTLFYFLIVIGILVIIHELGHFLAARMCGMRTDIFSFGMGKRLFGFNKINGFTFGNLPEDWDGGGICDYRVCLLPIGGYVKVAGMVDESMDTNYATSEPQPWEFRSKNALQKIFVLSAGVIMNILLAIGIFAFISLNYGSTDYLTTEVGYVQANSVGTVSGLQVGDNVKEINGVKIQSWSEFVKNLTIEDMGNAKKITVIRNGQEQVLNVEGEKLVNALVNVRSLGIEPAGKKVVLGSVVFNMPAQLADLAERDTILTINGKNIASQYEMMDSLKANKNKAVELSYKRSMNIVHTKITPNESGLIGVQLYDIYTGKESHINYGFFEAIKLGSDQTFGLFGLILDSFGQIFTGKINAKDAIGGPIMIAKQSGENAKRGLDAFLMFMAQLSVSLALINIMPFPALDGGHILITMIEAAIRRELPLKVKMIIQNVGVVVLLGLMALVFVMDILR